MRIMLDTNILISMIFFPSEQTRKLAKILGECYRIVLCDYVITELQLVVKRKFSSRKKALDQFLNELPYDLIRTAKITSGEGIPEIRDKKDFPILATAITEDVDIILSGDKDFLVLTTKKPKILTMTEFLAQYDR